MIYHPGFYTLQQPCGLKQDHIGLFLCVGWGRIDIPAENRIFFVGKFNPQLRGLPTDDTCGRARLVDKAERERLLATGQLYERGGYVSYRPVVMLGDRRVAAKVEAQLSVHNRSDS